MLPHYLKDRFYPQLFDLTDLSRYFISKLDLSACFMERCAIEYFADSDYLHEKLQAIDAGFFVQSFFNTANLFLCQRFNRQRKKTCQSISIDSSRYCKSGWQLVKRDRANTK